MTYEEAVAYFAKTPRFGKKPTLSRVRSLLKELGNPEKSLKFAHIAGTNGKGSTAAMMESVLRAAGYRTGLFISPFVEDFRERMQLCGQMIAPEDLARHTATVAAAVRALDARGEEHPTEFELVFAAAMCYFTEAKCDIVVLETGLGGRFDATNAIASPEVCVITSISFDHMAQLGSSLTKIAYEKCGIIKRGCEVVCYPLLPDDVRTVIDLTRADMAATLTVPDVAALTVHESGPAGSDITYRARTLHVSLLGRHQIYNCVTALEALGALERRGFKIPADAYARGIAACSFGGRLETICRHPLTLIDGAHNPSGVEALCENLDALFPGQRIIALMGMLEDKAYEACIPMVAKRSDVFIAVAPPSPRALTAFAAAQCARPFCPHVFCPGSIPDAVALARKTAGDEDVIIVCGSLFMIGEAKREFLKE